MPPSPRTCWCRHRAHASPSSSARRPERRKATVRSPISCPTASVKPSSSCSSRSCFALWKGRRLGRPVAETQPVQIAGSELVVAVGNLMQKAGRPEAAASQLRDDLRRDLTSRLGLAAERDRGCHRGRGGGTKRGVYATGSTRPSPQRRRRPPMRSSERRKRSSRSAPTSSDEGMMPLVPDPEGAAPASDAQSAPRGGARGAHRGREGRRRTGRHADRIDRRAARPRSRAARRRAQASPRRCS